ncbi:MAG: integrase core domain-containing protein, partial [Pseudomonadota bacterium]
FRQECLSAHWFPTLPDAREKMEAWRRFYNKGRPHSAIGYKLPISRTDNGGASDPPPIRAFRSTRWISGGNRYPSSTVARSRRSTPTG